MAEDKTARPVSELDKASQQRLEAIKGQDPKGLTVQDRQFLFGRRAYLTADERAKFGVTDSEPVNEAGEDEVVEDAYEGMTAPELKEELRSRDLPVSGTVGALRARLREDDKTRA